MEFENLFYGKPVDFVVERLGKPDKEQDLFAINTIWYWYKKRTYSGSINNMDNYVGLKFEYDENRYKSIIAISYK